MTISHKVGQPRELENSIVVITGASGGLGQACAEQFASAGAQLVLVARELEKLEELRNRLAHRGDGEALLVTGDISDPGLADDCFQKTRNSLARPVDILVNNAGTITRATAAATQNEDWHRVMNVNVSGLFYFSRAFAQQQHDGGAIINVSSTCGSVGSAGLAAYCASKGAVNQLTRAMALELADRAITVNAVAPGAIDSPMLYRGHANSALADTVVARNETSIPLGAIAQPQEVARAILFLAQERHVTGTILAVDGGYTAC